MGIAVLGRVVTSVRSQSAVPSFALLPRQRNRQADVALQTFPAPPSSPIPLVVSFGTGNRHAPRGTHHCGGCVRLAFAGQVPSGD